MVGFAWDFSSLGLCTLAYDPQELAVSFRVKSHQDLPSGVEDQMWVPVTRIAQQLPSPYSDPILPA